MDAARIASSISWVNSTPEALMRPSSTLRQAIIESSRQPSQSKMKPLAFANRSNETTSLSNCLIRRYAFAWYSS